MGVPNDDVVLIQKGKRPGEPHVITVNCPDKTGLGCDICRIILDFGLYITKGGNFSFDVIVAAAVSFAFFVYVLTYLIELCFYCHEMVEIHSSGFLVCFSILFNI